VAGVKVQRRPLCDEQLATGPGLYRAMRQRRSSLPAMCPNTLAAVAAITGSPAATVLSSGDHEAMMLPPPMCPIIPALPPAPLSPFLQSEEDEDEEEEETDEEEEEEDEEKVEEEEKEKDNMKETEKEEQKEEEDGVWDGIEATDRLRRQAVSALRQQLDSAHVAHQSEVCKLRYELQGHQSISAYKDHAVHGLSEQCDNLKQVVAKLQQRVGLYKMFGAIRTVLLVRSLRLSREFAKRQGSDCIASYADSVLGSEANGIASFSMTEAMLALEKEVDEESVRLGNDEPILAFGVKIVTNPDLDAAADAIDKGEALSLGHSVAQVSVAPLGSLASPTSQGRPIAQTSVPCAPAATSAPTRAAVVSMPSLTCERIAEEKVAQGVAMAATATAPVGTKPVGNDVQQTPRNVDMACTVGELTDNRRRPSVFTRNLPNTYRVQRLIALLKAVALPAPALINKLVLRRSRTMPQLPGLTVLCKLGESHRRQSVAAIASALSREVEFRSGDASEAAVEVTSESCMVDRSTSPIWWPPSGMSPVEMVPELWDHRIVDMPTETGAASNDIVRAANVTSACGNDLALSESVVAEPNHSQCMDGPVCPSAKRICQSIAQRELQQLEGCKLPSISRNALQSDRVHRREKTLVLEPPDSSKPRTVYVRPEQRSFLTCRRRDGAGGGGAGSAQASTYQSHMTAVRATEHKFAL